MFRTPGSRAKLKPYPKIGLFQATRGGTDQTGLTASADNKITWLATNANNNSWFNLTTGKYIPLLPGTYVFSLQTNANFGTGCETCQAELWKNGVKNKSGSYLPILTG